MKKLPMAAFLTPEHPSFFLEALQNLANFHRSNVPRPGNNVNAERQSSGTARRERADWNSSPTAPLPEAISFGRFIVLFFLSNTHGKRLCNQGKRNHEGGNPVAASILRVPR